MPDVKPYSLKPPTDAELTLLVDALLTYRYPPLPERIKQLAQCARRLEGNTPETIRIALSVAHETILVGIEERDRQVKRAREEYSDQRERLWQAFIRIERDAVQKLQELQRLVEEYRVHMFR
jgi:hypothetical protein